MYLGAENSEVAEAWVNRASNSTCTLGCVLIYMAQNSPAPVAFTYTRLMFIYYQMRGLQKSRLSLSLGTAESYHTRNQLYLETNLQVHRKEIDGD
jgi:hypothetical protein